MNEAEQANILEAQSWAYKKRKINVLDTRLLNQLHKRMFGRVWKWAGTFRKTGKNIGVDAYKIPTDLRQLIDDCTYWIDHQTYGLDEIATRFHHRLVLIHAYPNGNGRHARLATDLLLRSLGIAPFSWGRESLTDPGKTRSEYIDALRCADRNDYEPLLRFVRS